MQKNIIKSSEAVRNMYKSESEHEMFLHALEALELVTGENGLKKRLSDVEETNKWTIKTSQSKTQKSESMSVN